jgi:hypothetical protein
MDWKMQTHRFGADEMALLEQLPADKLAAMLKRSDALVALRGLAEVMLNGDGKKLKALLKDSQLTAHWRQFGTDPEVDHADRSYAQRLEQHLKR